MKITKIKIDSLYGVKHLELDGSGVELTGPKGSGKTSVIDSIKYALTNKSDRDWVVKNGEREGEIFIETDTGVSINRKKRTDAGDYIKVSELGKAVKSPQSFINEIFTPLQLNPVEFASWDKNVQNRAILDLIEFDWNTAWIKEQFGEIPKGVDYGQHILSVLESIQAKNGDYWTRREELNRKELYKRQQLTDIAQKIPQNYKADAWQSYDIKAKSVELQKVQETNSRIDRAIVFYQNYKDKVRGIEAEKDIEIAAEETAINVEKTGLASSIERLKAEIKAAEEKLLTLGEKLEDKKKIAVSACNEKIAKLDGDVEIAKQYKDLEKQSIAELQAELDEAITMKEYLSEYRSMVDMKAECEDFKTQSEELTRKITIARTLPGKVLESAQIPVQGLSVKDGVPLINGLPISNLSGGEKIELCIDITLAQKQNLEIVLIDGAEALDKESREKLYAKCKEKGLQIIAARTTDDNEFNIVEL